MSKKNPLSYLKVLLPALAMSLMVGCASTGAVNQAQADADAAMAKAEQALSAANAAAAAANEAKAAAERAERCCARLEGQQRK